MCDSLHWYPSSNPSSFGRPGVSKSRSLGESNVQTVLGAELQLGHWRHRAGAVGVEDIPILHHSMG